jgi:hypothetical protein
LTVRAQDSAKPRRIGFLAGGSRPALIEGTVYDGFRQGMRQLGYTEGKDFIIEWRFAEGKYERFPDLAAELARLNVDVIVLGAMAAVRPTQKVTSTIPIVMGNSIDPVGNGLVASLARPGGNTTGLSSAFEDYIPKLLELVKTIVPQLSSVAIFINPNNEIGLCTSLKQSTPLTRASTRWLRQGSAALVLGCVVMAFGCEPKGAFAAPYNVKTEISIPVASENIVISNIAIDIQTAASGFFNLGYFTVGKQFGEIGNAKISLLKPERRDTWFLEQWKNEIKIYRQWIGENIYLGINNDIACGCKSAVTDNRLNFIFNIGVPILLDYGTWKNRNVSSQLTSRVFAERCSDPLHCISGSRRFNDIFLHIIGLIRGGLDSLSQPSGLQSKYDQLKKTDYCKNGTCNNQIAVEINEFPIKRRFIFAFFCLPSGFFLSLWGWKCFDNQRHLFGAALICSGWLLGGIGLGLVWLTNFPNTWGWLL